MKAGCNSTPESSCMGNIRTLEPDFEYISTQKYQAGTGYDFWILFLRVYPVIFLDFTRIKVLSFGT